MFTSIIGRRRLLIICLHVLMWGNLVLALVFIACECYPLSFIAATVFVVICREWRKCHVKVYPNPEAN